MNANNYRVKNDARTHENEISDLTNNLNSDYDFVQVSFTKPVAKMT